MLPINASFIIVDEPDSFAAVAADKLAQIISSFGDRPRLISLSGGSTPFPVYRQLAKVLAHNGTGNKCYWMQTDERLVAANDPRSNQMGIKNSLMEAGFLPQSSFIPAISGGLQGDISAIAPQKICDDYAQALMQLPAEIRPPAPIDLLILGVGTDGHTASLFPDTDWQTRKTPAGFAVFVTKSQPEARLSLTLSHIMQAREIVFLVSGASKQPVLEKIFFDPEFTSPAAYLARNRRVIWLVDSEAAGKKLTVLLKAKQ